MISLPGYYQDPFFNKTQADLYGFGSNLLKGDVPEYYRPIGEIGGSELENLIALTTRDATKQITENAARVGNRGGIKTIAPAIADVSTKLRYQDLLRALEGRQFFLNTGNEMIGGVRNAGLSEQNSRNSFNLKSAEMRAEDERFERSISEKKKAEKAALYRTLLSSGIGFAGNMYGMGMISKALSAGGGAGSFSMGMPAGSQLMSGDYYNF